MQKEIQESMTIRDPRFVKGSLRVERAKLVKPVAEVGSIERDRFTGWKEQEKGTPSPKDRKQTLTARRSNWKHRVAPRFRLKPGKKKFIRPTDMKLKNRPKHMRYFLLRLARKRYKQPFYLPIQYKRFFLAYPSLIT